MSSTISVPRTSYQMIISPDPARRKQTVDDFANRCNGILQEALKWAPAVTRSLLHVRNTSILLVCMEFLDLLDCTLEILAVKQLPLTFLFFIN